MGRHWKKSGRNAARFCAHPEICHGVVAWRCSAPQPGLTRDQW